MSGAQDPKAAAKGPVKFDLPAFVRPDVQRLVEARRVGMQMNRQKDIRAGGNEVEIPLRDVLAARLPEICHVGQGHVVDANLAQSPQCDVIITSGGNTPILFRGADDTTYYPYEAVLAVGEVKSTYHRAENYIEKFSRTLRYLRDEMVGPDYKVTDYGKINHVTAFIEFRDPLFSFMFFVDSGDFEIEQVAALYRGTSWRGLPRLVCFLDKGVIVGSSALNPGTSRIPIPKGHPTYAQIEQISMPGGGRAPCADDIPNDWLWQEIPGDPDERRVATFALFYELLLSNLLAANPNRTVNLRPYMRGMFSTLQSKPLF